MVEKNGRNKVLKKIRDIYFNEWKWLNKDVYILAWIRMSLKKIFWVPI